LRPFFSPPSVLLLPFKRSHAVSLNRHQWRTRTGNNLIALLRMAKMWLALQNLRSLPGCLGYEQYQGREGNWYRIEFAVGMRTGLRAANLMLICISTAGIAIAAPLISLSLSKAIRERRRRWLCPNTQSFSRASEPQKLRLRFTAIMRGQ